MRSSVSRTWEWYSSVGLVRRLGEEGGHLDRLFLYYPFDVSPKGGMQDSCTHLRTMPARHSRKSGSNGERRGKRNTPADHISTSNRCDAPVVGHKKVGYGIFAVRCGRWPARSPAYNESGSRTC